jgi:hypothetical protein
MWGKRPELFNVDAEMIVVNLAVRHRRASRVHVKHTGDGSLDSEPSRAVHCLALGVIPWLLTA